MKHCEIKAKRCNSGSFFMRLAGLGQDFLGVRFRKPGFPSKLTFSFEE